MKPTIVGINSLIAGNTAKDSNLKTGREGSFIAYLNNALKEVDDLQKEASLSAVRFSIGEEEYLHNVMLAYEKASLALQLTVEVRNKLVEAYQEIMRMQM